MSVLETEWHLGAMTLTLGVTTYGLVTDQRGVAFIAVAATLAVAVALVSRARSSLRAAERRRVELDRANALLQQRNASLRTMHLAVRQGFDVIDERTQGRLRELVEQTGDDLAAIVAERLD